MTALCIRARSGPNVPSLFHSAVLSSDVVRVCESSSLELERDAVVAAVKAWWTLGLDRRCRELDSAVAALDTDVCTTTSPFCSCVHFSLAVLQRMYFYPDINEISL